MSEKQAKVKEPKSEKKQRGPFKKTRGGVVLTKDEVREIKEGRHKLRRELRKAGIKDKKDFEVTASSLGLYFDKNKKLALFLWFLRRWGGPLLLALGVLALALLYAFSLISQYRGHFTISMSDAMFREGFSLSDNRDFKNPTSHLFCTPAENVPCISITDIPENVNQVDASHNGKYFAYKFYLRNEGESTVDYRWKMSINSESKDLSKAAWLMVFEDDKMQFYAKPDEFGRPEVLPSSEILSKSEYTEDSWNNMLVVYEDASDIINHAKSQAEVDAAASSLKTAIDSLKVADPEKNSDIYHKELINLIARASQLNETDYTPETWAKMQKALEEARKVIEKAELQDEVDSAVAELRESIENKKDTPVQDGAINYGELSYQLSRVFGNGYAYVDASIGGLKDKCMFPEDQYEVIKQTDNFRYYRLIPKPFVSDDVAAEGIKTAVKPMEIHEYTVVIWLEGDDPDCTNDLIGGHLGLEVHLELIQ